MSVPSAPTMCHATDASFRFKRQTNRYRDTHTHRQRHTFQTFKIPFICTFCFTFHPPEAIQCNADLPKKKKKRNTHLWCKKHVPSCTIIFCLKTMMMKSAVRKTSGSGWWLLHRELCKHLTPPILIVAAGSECTTLNLDNPSCSLHVYIFRCL